MPELARLDEMRVVNLPAVFGPPRSKLLAFARQGRIDGFRRVLRAHPEEPWRTRLRTSASAWARIPAYDAVRSSRVRVRNVPTSTSACISEATKGRKRPGWAGGIRSISYGSPGASRDNRDPLSRAVVAASGHQSRSSRVEMGRHIGPPALSSRSK